MLFALYSCWLWLIMYVVGGASQAFSLVPRRSSLGTILDVSNCASRIETMAGISRLQPVLGRLYLARRPGRISTSLQLCMGRALSTSPHSGQPERSLSQAWNWVVRRGRGREVEVLPHPLGVAAASGSSPLELIPSSPAQEVRLGHSSSR